jgi:hypothetical protein
VPTNHSTTSTADKCAAVTAKIIEQLDAQALHADTTPRNG